MFNYEEFKSVVADHIKDYLPEVYANQKTDIQTYQKTNQTLDGMTIPTGERCSAILYLNPMYEEYRNGKSLDELLKGAAALIVSAEQEMDVSQVISPEYIRENIFMCLINRSNNQELLSTVPYQKYQDLAVVYRFRCSQEPVIASGIITKAVQKELKLEDEELHALALENTRKLYPPEVKSMNEVVREIMQRDMGAVADFGPEAFSEVDSMYVISNSEKYYGAASVIYDDVLQELAGTVGCDLYLLPSSLHEMIAVPSRFADADALSQMVRDVNRGEVGLEEQLSNNVYHYDKEQHSLTLATDAPEKLESRQMEPGSVQMDVTVEEPNKPIRTQSRSR